MGKKRVKLPKPPGTSVIVSAMGMIGGGTGMVLAKETPSCPASPTFGPLPMKTTWLPLMLGSVGMLVKLPVPFGIGVLRSATLVGFGGTKR